MIGRQLFPKMCGRNFSLPPSSSLHISFHLSLTTHFSSSKNPTFSSLRLAALFIIFFRACVLFSLHFRYLMIWPPFFIKKALRTRFSDAEDTLESLRAEFRLADQPVTDMLATHGSGRPRSFAFEHQVRSLLASGFSSLCLSCTVLI